MNLERWIKNTLALQRIPAPTFHEDQRAEFMHNAFLANGLRPVEMDAAGNVYGRIKGGERPPVIVTAHLDTVFSPDEMKSATRYNGKLTGPSVGDNSVALAVLIELAIDLGSTQPRGDVWLVSNVGEEGLGNLVGMHHVVERFGDRVSAYVALEGMSLGFIYHQGLPVRRFRLRAETPGGHSWIHAGRASAIHQLVALIHNLVDLSGGQKDQVSFNIGRIEGGTSVNTIASWAEAELDLRSTSEPALHELISQIEAAIDQHDKEEVAVRFDAIGHRPGGGIPEDHPLVRAAWDAAEDAGIQQPSLQTGSTDASLPLSLGLPAICVGLTRGGEAHTANEYIEIEPLKTGYQALRSLIDAAFEIGR